MKYNQFLKALEDNQALGLSFEFESTPIRKDYHITEVLSTSVSAIDCGKGVARWNESVIQLFEPKKETGTRFMSVGKALDIFKKSSKAISIPSDANVVLEFKPLGALAAQRYNIADIQVREGKLFVISEGATTQCKPAQKTGTGCC